MESEAKSDATDIIRDHQQSLSDLNVVGLRVKVPNQLPAVA